MKGDDLLVGGIRILGGRIRNLWFGEAKKSFKCEIQNSLRAELGLWEMVLQFLGGRV